MTLRDLTPDIQLWQGDCLEAMGRIPDGSVDLVAADLPYAVTACKWDQLIPFDALWAHYRRLLKPRGAVVLTASQPFTSALVMSNPKWFRHSWVWDKQQITNFQLANVAPLRDHEDVVVFSPGACPYHPQMTPKAKVIDKRRWSVGNRGKSTLMHIRSESESPQQKILTHDYPRTILRNARFCSCAGECNGPKRIHPTQKPVALFEYLIRTYSNLGETVLDNTCGSATTLIACLNTNRRAIGIEKDPAIYATARARLDKALAEREGQLLTA